MAIQLARKPKVYLCTSVFWSFIEQSVQVSSSEYAEVRISLGFQSLCFDPRLSKIKPTSAQKPNLYLLQNRLFPLTNVALFTLKCSVFKRNDTINQSSKPRHPNFLRRRNPGGALVFIGWPVPNVYVKA